MDPLIWANAFTAASLNGHNDPYSFADRVLRKTVARFRDGPPPTDDESSAEREGWLIDNDDFSPD